MTILNDIDKAWDEYLEAIHEATEIVRQSAGDDPYARAERYKFLMSGFTSMWKSTGYPDRNFPIFAESFSPVFDYGSTTPEFFYQLVHIQPEGVYRVWGNRGTASYIDLSQNAQWMGETADGEINDKENAQASEVLQQDNFDEVIPTDENGNFDVIWSVDKPASGNWWPRHPGTRSLFTRNILVDWEKELPWDVNIERLDWQSLTPARRTPDESAHRIRQQAANLYAFAKICTNMVGNVAKQAGYNHFLRQSFEGDGGHLDQIYWFLTLQLQPDEALLLEWHVGGAESVVYWDAVLNDSAWACLDYRTIQSSLNNAQAEVGDDGIFRAIISPNDPGISNWLDTHDGEAALLMLRAKRCEGIGEPEASVLPLEQTIAKVQDKLTSVDNEQRKAQLRKRRIDFDRRYRGLQ